MTLIKNLRTGLLKLIVTFDYYESWAERNEVKRGEGLLITEMLWWQLQQVAAYSGQAADRLQELCSSKLCWCHRLRSRWASASRRRLQLMHGVARNGRQELDGVTCVLRNIALIYSRIWVCCLMTVDSFITARARCSCSFVLSLQSAMLR